MSGRTLADEDGILKRCRTRGIDLDERRAGRVLEKETEGGETAVVAEGGVGSEVGDSSRTTFEVIVVDLDGVTLRLHDNLIEGTIADDIIGDLVRRTFHRDPVPRGRVDRVSLDDAVSRRGAVLGPDVHAVALVRRPVDRIARDDTVVGLIGADERRRAAGAVGIGDDIRRDRNSIHLVLHVDLVTVPAVDVVVRDDAAVLGRADGGPHGDRGAGLRGRGGLVLEDVAHDRHAVAELREDSALNARRVGDRVQADQHVVVNLDAVGLPEGDDHVRVGAAVGPLLPLPLEEVVVNPREMGRSQPHRLPPEVIVKVVVRDDDTLSRFDVDPPHEVIAGEAQPGDERFIGGRTDREECRAPNGVVRPEGRAAPPHERDPPGDRETSHEIGPVREDDRVARAGGVDRTLDRGRVVGHSAACRSELADVQALPVDAKPLLALIDPEATHAVGDSRHAASASRSREPAGGEGWYPSGRGTGQRRLLRRCWLSEREER